MDEVRLHSVPVPKATAEILQSIEQEPPEKKGNANWEIGVTLYLLARLAGPRTLLDAGPVTASSLWLALAAQRAGASLYVRVGDEEERDRLHTLLERAQLHPPLELLPPAEFAAQRDEVSNAGLVRLAREDGRSTAPFMEQVATRGASDTLFFIEDVGQSAPGFMPEMEGWHHLWLGLGGGALLASRVGGVSLDEQEPRAILTAMLLHILRPPTLALGPNIVFYGTMKPPSTRVNFSGMGGQIGAGDLLITYPDDLQRYTPLPGAVALVYGEPASEIRAPHIVLPLREGAVTLVVA